CGADDEDREQAFHAVTIRRCQCQDSGLLSRVCAGVYDFTAAAVRMENPTGVSGMDDVVCSIRKQEAHSRVQREKPECRTQNAERRTKNEERRTKNLGSSNF